MAAASPLIPSLNKMGKGWPSHTNICKGWVGRKCGSSTSGETAYCRVRFWWNTGRYRCNFTPLHTTCTCYYVYFLYVLVQCLFQNIGKAMKKWKKGWKFQPFSELSLKKWNPPLRWLLSRHLNFLGKHLLSPSPQWFDWIKLREDWIVLILGEHSPTSITNYWIVVKTERECER